MVLGICPGAPSLPVSGSPAFSGPPRPRGPFDARTSGGGPPIVDPWLVMAVVAASTTRSRLGAMITPVPRRRPWQLAKETATLDRLSNGRLILGVGIGSPAYGDFGIFHEPDG